MRLELAAHANRHAVKRFQARGTFATAHLDHHLLQV